MLSYSDIMNLMKQYNDLKKTIELKDTPLNSEDKDLQEFNKVVKVLSAIKIQIQLGNEDIKVDSTNINNNT
jgi:hypothetical protein